jgi:integrase
LVKRGGKQFRRSLQTTDRRLAERRLADLRQKVDRLTCADDSGLSFDDLATRWIELTAGESKPRSLERRRSALKGLAPFFPATSIRSVTRAQCERWATERGAEIAAQTFDHELSVLKRVLDYAVGSGLRLDNPAAHIGRRPIKHPKINVPSREQFVRLVAAIRHSDGRPDSQNKAKHGADLVELLAYSGMRLGEATALLWRDVDFDRNTLTVTGGEAGTKNHEFRVVPMADALRSLLKRFSGETQPRPESCVIPTSDAKTAINKACKRLGLPHFHHHDFRHFFATTCIEAGVDIPTVARWLGHKDGGALAMRVYGHLRPEHSFKQIKLVSFGSEDGPSSGDRSEKPAANADTARSPK